MSHPRPSTRQRSHPQHKARHRGQEAPERCPNGSECFSTEKSYETTCEPAGRTPVLEPSHEWLADPTPDNYDLSESGKCDSVFSDNSNFSNNTPDLTSSIYTTGTEVEDTVRIPSLQIGAYRTNDCNLRKELHIGPERTRINPSQKLVDRCHKSNIHSAPDTWLESGNPKSLHREKSTSYTCMPEMEDAFIEGSAMDDPAWASDDNALEEKGRSDPFWEWDGRNFRHRDTDGKYIYFPDQLR